MNDLNDIEGAVYNVLKKTSTGLLTVVAENLTKMESETKVAELTDNGVNPERIKVQRVP